MARSSIGPRLIVSDDFILQDTYTAAPSWWSRMFVAVGLTTRSTELGSRTAEAELTAADVQRTFLACFRLSE